MLSVLNFACNRIVGAIQTPAVALLAVILANPVIGQPLSYVVQGGTPAGITSQQWYRNTGSGPVLIPGATDVTYTPTKTSPISGSDVGAWFSVRGAGPGFTFTSQEFATTGQVLAPAALSSTASPQSGTNYIATVATTVTFTSVVSVRMTGTGTTNYFETIVAPGTYPGGTTTFGDPAQIVAGGTQFNCNLYSHLSLCPPPCIDQVVDSTPATTTRPAASTGVGFFNKGGELYDANGTKCRLRGLNRLHYDANPPTSSTGLFNAKANVHRLNMYFHRDWATINKPLMDDMIATNHKTIPMPAIWYVNAVFTGTVSGTTLTVTAMTSGTICVSGVRSSSVSTTFASGSGVSTTELIAQQLTNTNTNGIPGKEGTYRLLGSYTISTPTSFNYTNSPTGLQNAESMIAAAQLWCDNYSNFAPYERWMILNIANEWGPVGSGASTVWRDTAITCISMLRAAGYKCPIVVDAPGNGQDGATGGRAWTLLNHGAAVAASDSQANTMLSLHCYGVYQAGALAAVAASLRTFATTNGVTVIIGEFGPANQNIAPGSVTTAQTLETLAVAEACQLGHIWWAWDDPASATSGAYTYSSYAACIQAGSDGFNTSDPAQLTYSGNQIVLDPVYGLVNAAVPATVFP
jgi:hypothetical protein